VTVHMLPVEVLEHLWTNVGYQTLARSQRVCSQWRDILAGEAGERLWRAEAQALWATRQAPIIPRAGCRTSWKQEFAFRLTDAARCRLTTAELTCAEWRFRFRHDLQAMHLTDAEREQYRERAPATLHFDPDGFYSSTIPGAPSALRPLRWRLMAASGGDSALVQIGSCNDRRAPNQETVPGARRAVSRFARAPSRCVQIPCCRLSGRRTGAGACATSLSSFTRRRGRPRRAGAECAASAHGLQMYLYTVAGHDGVLLPLYSIVPVAWVGPDIESVLVVRRSLVVCGCF